MRTVLEAAGPYEVDTTDGVRVLEDAASWALVLPDPAEAVTHLWAEAPQEEQALALLARWVGVVESARA
jgi:mannose-1-phosphate guanylyltransferase/phosphomannomutase